MSSRGTTNLDNTSLSAIVKERNDGSGILRIDFITDLLGEQIISPGYECASGFTCYNATFVPAQLLNGTINAVLLAEDKAA